MPPPFKRLTAAEFAAALEQFPFTRRITSVHVHHTWRPNHQQFRGHDSIVGMWRFHTQERKFSDIAQHLTIAPDGGLWTGRNWNIAPASAAGFNGNGGSGPFMFETVGDFDQGKDPLAGPQRTAVLDVIKLLLVRFSLTPEAVKFHNQMAPKSCPGTGIVRGEFLREVRDHAPSVASTRSRGATRGLGGKPSRAAAKAIEALTAPLRSRAVEPPDAELDDGEAPRAVRGTLSRGGGELGDGDIRSLRPHVVNLRMGKFSPEGRMTTSAKDVDALFDKHLPRWLAERPDPSAPAPIVFYAHGGLVSESTGLAGANRAREWWLANGIYPIYFIWETGLFQTIGDLLGKVWRKAAPEGERGLADRLSDPIVEEAMRALQSPRIWGGMKLSAGLASAEDGGARYVAQRLAEFLRRHRGTVRLHAVGHSAGSIFHAHFLPLCAESNATFESLHLLAPAVTCDEFKQRVVPLVGPGTPVRHTTLFTMKRAVERADQCAWIYRKSLLYLVSEACEDKRKTPILGLEDSLRKDAALLSFFGLGASPSQRGEVVWSKSPAADGLSASRSTTHGGFDDDAPTMGSVARRILGLGNDDPIEPFPAAPTDRGLSRDWSDEVDWPESLSGRPKRTVRARGARRRA